MERKTVVIAGATGFVGSALARRLADDFRVVGLTRGDPAAARVRGGEWRRCDLFSLLQCERALEGADVACYLVHSMLPSAHLTQGAFQDMDLIMADNFARAAARAGLQQIVYLGGLLPDEPELSQHLQSRLEVEQTLGSRGTPVTALRAGIVIGAGGSSYRIFKTLVERFPIIPCSRWVYSLTQPIALPDVLELIRYCLLHPSGGSRTCDIGSPDVMTYRELLERTARILGLRRWFVDLPFTGTTWRRYWLRFATGAPLELIVPLLESMRHCMVTRDRRLQEEAGIPGLQFEEAVRRALAEKQAGTPLPPRTEYTTARRLDRRIYRYHVRSVQRVRLPAGRTASWAAEMYLQWLSRLFRSVLRAEVEGRGRVRIILSLLRVSLLEHVLAADRSGESDRQVFYITGGVLARRAARKTRRPRLEFREVLGGTTLLAAIHDYRPTLPWPIYNVIQARLHLWVMRRFARRILAAGPAPASGDFAGPPASTSPAVLSSRSIAPA